MKHSCGKSPSLVGKSTISRVIFKSYFDITRGYISVHLWSGKSSLPSFSCLIVLSRSIPEPHRGGTSGAANCDPTTVTRGFAQSKATTQILCAGVSGPMFNTTTGWWSTYPSEKYLSIGMIFSNIRKNKKRSKPPTRTTGHRILG